MLRTCEPLQGVDKLPVATGSFFSHSLLAHALTHTHTTCTHAHTCTHTHTHTHTQGAYGIVRKATDDNDELYVSSHTS